MVVEQATGHFVHSTFLGLRLIAHSSLSMHIQSASSSMLARPHAVAPHVGTKAGTWTRNKDSRDGPARESPSVASGTWQSRRVGVPTRGIPDTCNPFPAAPQA